MKEILGIVASPRKGGNCEIVIKEMARQLGGHYGLKLLRLPDFLIRPCKACYRCLSGEERCVQDDSLDVILDAMCTADALIIASPVYFLGANATLKALLDRGLSFYGRAKEQWHKPAVGITVSGIRGKEGYAPLVVESFLKAILADIRHIETVYAAFPGEVMLSEDNKHKIKNLAVSLLGTAVEKDGPVCPLCGGNSFSFTGRNKVRCLLCSNTGRMKIVNGSITFEIDKDGHELFLSDDLALEHREWLREMKRRFFDELPELKNIRDRYRDIGEWIEPPK